MSRPNNSCQLFEPQQHFLTINYSDDETMSKSVNSMKNWTIGFKFKHSQANLFYIGNFFIRKTEQHKFQGRDSISKKFLKTVP